MIIVDLQQGSPEWHEHRAKHFNASDAPAMMGVSKYKTRAQLLREYATGVIAEIDPATQRRFDEGHKAEAAAREIAERMIGEELYPVTGTLAVDGLNLSASFDGITMDGLKCWEHKLFNKSLAESMKLNECDPHYYWQLEHQLLVAETDETLFMTSDGTEDNCESMTYLAVAGRRAQLMAGWKQFAEDLANYQHVEVAAEAVGRVPDALPALRIEVTGMVTNSNLEAFKAGAELMFSRINRDLQTDQDFADAEKTVKHCKEVEDNIEAAKKHALSQTASIDELYRALDSVSAQARTVRLELDRLVKARKENIRAEIQQEAEILFKAHVDTINARLGKVQLPAINTDFAGAMKGKKTVASLRDAADTELARAKIETSQLSETIGANVTSLRDLAAGYEFLFMDAQQICQKQNDDLVLLIKSRIDEHKKAEQATIDAEVARQVEAAKVVEPVVAPELVAAIHKATHQEAPQEQGQPATAKRPTDKQIIFAVATQYNVDFHTAVKWLKEMDFSEMRDVA